MTDSSTYRHILFDFDGVLCDSAALSVEIYHELRKRDFPDLPNIAGVADLNWVCAGRPGTWLAPWLGIDRANDFWRSHENMLFDLAGELGLFPHLGELLVALPRGSISIVTGGRAQRVRRVLTRCMGGIPQSVAYIAGAEDSGGKVEKVGRALTLSSSSAACAVYVGDTVSDIICCKAIPIDVMAVGYGFQAVETLDQYQPTWSVESPEHLAMQIRQWRNLD